jgi:hypothetical protein
MKRTTSIFSIFLAITLFSCNSESEEGQLNIIVPEEISDLDTLSDIEEIITEEETVIIPLQLSIDSFTEFPSEIDSCACYFSKTLDEFNKGEYIYMDDYGSKNAFMKLDGEMTKLNVDYSTWEDSGNGAIGLSNETYAILLTFQEVSKLDETFQKEGTLTIINNDLQEIAILFFGECGC